ncbi:MAG TPA: protein-disulfide reductase DsbD domain-containing protein [Casimicrobiaceae bacterium]
MALALAGTVAAAGLPVGEPKLLPPEQAFRFSARALDSQTLEARFDVVDGYYLYRDKLAFSLEPATAGTAKPELPKGERHHDEFFGDVQTYRGRVVVRLPLTASPPGSTVTLKAQSQGCADAGVCYPPTIQQVRLSLPARGAGPGPIVEAPRKKGLFE